MSFGPVELIVIDFPGSKFKGEIIPTLRDLVDKGVIKIIDIIFASKDKNGSVTVAELADLEDETYKLFEPVVSDVVGMLSEEDAVQLADMLDNNSSAGIMLFENTWAGRFSEAVKNADGQVVLDEHIPRSVIEKLSKEKAVNKK